MTQKSNESNLTDVEQKVKQWLTDRTGKVPTDEDVRESIRNMKGFLDVMREWLVEDRRKENSNDK